MYHLSFETPEGIRTITFNSKPFPLEISYAAQDLLEGKRCVQVVPPPKEPVCA